MARAGLADSWAAPAGTRWPRWRQSSWVEGEVEGVIVVVVKKDLGGDEGNWGMRKLGVGDKIEEGGGWR